MPITTPNGPLCEKALPDELAKELESVLTKAACRLEEDHRGACIAFLETPTLIGQVAWWPKPKPPRRAGRPSEGDAA